MTLFYLVIIGHSQDIPFFCYLNFLGLHLWLEYSCTVVFLEKYIGIFFIWL